MSQAVLAEQRRLQRLRPHIPGRWVTQQSYLDADCASPSRVSACARALTRRALGSGDGARREGRGGDGCRHGRDSRRAHPRPVLCVCVAAAYARAATGV
jgi:hypothetical protein